MRPDVRCSRFSVEGRSPLPSWTILQEANRESCSDRGGCWEPGAYPGPSLVTTGCTVTWANRNAAVAKTLAMLGSVSGS